MPKAKTAAPSKNLKERLDDARKVSNGTMPMVVVLETDAEVKQAKAYTRDKKNARKLTFITRAEHEAAMQAHRERVAEDIRAGIAKADEKARALEGDKPTGRGKRSGKAQKTSTSRAGSGTDKPSAKQEPERTSRKSKAQTPKATHENASDTKTPKTKKVKPKANTPASKPNADEGAPTKPAPAGGPAKAPAQPGKRAPKPSGKSTGTAAKAGKTQAASREKSGKTAKTGGAKTRR